MTTTNFVDKLVEENARLREIADALLCAKHATPSGLYAYLEDDGITPRGGGCIVCIGQRVDAENARLRAILETPTVEARTATQNQSYTWIMADPWHEYTLAMDGNHE